MSVTLILFCVPQVGEWAAMWSELLAKAQQHHCYYSGWASGAFACTAFRKEMFLLLSWSHTCMPLIPVACVKTCIYTYILYGFSFETGGGCCFGSGVVESGWLVGGWLCHVVGPQPRELTQTGQWDIHTIPCDAMMSILNRGSCYAMLCGGGCGLRSDVVGWLVPLVVGLLCHVVFLVVHSPFSLFWVLSLLWLSFSLHFCCCFTLIIKVFFSQPMTFLTFTLLILSPILLVGEGVSSCVGLSCWLNPNSCRIGGRQHRWGRTIRIQSVTLAFKLRFIYAGSSCCNNL